MSMTLPHIYEQVRAPFITKHLRKAIMNRPRCKHNYLKFPSRENLAMKSINYKCNNSLGKNAKT